LLETPQAPADPADPPQPIPDHVDAGVIERSPRPMRTTSSPGSAPTCTEHRRWGHWSRFAEPALTGEQNLRAIDFVNADYGWFDDERVGYTTDGERPALMGR
jgi:hypothetical protein